MFQQATASVSDYPEWIFEEWIMYEREEGTLETLSIAEAKIAKQKKRVDDMRAKVRVYFENFIIKLSKTIH